MFVPQSWYKADSSAKATANLASMEALIGEPATRFAQDPEPCIIGLMGGALSEVSQSVLKVHPGFAQVHAFIQAAYSEPGAYRDNVTNAFNAMAPFWNDPEYSGDYRFNLLIAVLGWALYRDDTDEGTRNVLNNLLERVLAGGEVLGLFENSLLGSMLWFADYGGYRQLVADQYQVVCRERATKAAADQREREEEERKREAEKQRVRIQRMKQGKCVYCGGSFKGLLRKTCSSCGRPKDY